MRLDGELGGLNGLFSWLTRNRMGPAFGDIPIGWYQADQCHALDVLEETFGRGAEVRVVDGTVTDGKVSIDCAEVWKRASAKGR